MKQLTIYLILLISVTARAAEVIPPSPPRHFNDYAGVTSTATQRDLDNKLLDLENRESTQIVVVVYPKMQSNSDVSDFATRVFNAWKVGQKGKNNGAILFVFVNDHRMWIQTGYGLEGSLPDATCKQIIDQQIAPRFKQGDYNGGLRAGVDSMISAVHGEFKGNPQPRSSSGGNSDGGMVCVAIFVLFFLYLFISGIIQGLRGGGGYRRRGWWGPMIYSGSSSGWGDSGGGSWGGGGGGGGFSGGGGSSGGGGAGGSW